MSDAILQSMSFIPPLVVILVSLLIVNHQGFDRNTTVSVHAAKNPKTSFILSLTILICGTLYYLVLWLWIGPKYNLPFMNILVILAFIGMILLALMPADLARKWSRRLHTSAGVLLMTEMYIITLLVAMSPHLTNMWVVMLTGVALIFATLLPFALLLFPRIKREALVLEVGCVGLFYGLTIVWTYL